MATLDELVVRIKADASQLERELKRVQGITQQSTDRMGSSFGALATQMRGLAPALGAAALVTFGRQAIDAAGRMNDLAGRIGFASDTLSALEGRLAANGASLDDFAASINLMNANIGQAVSGNEQLAEAFSRLGLSIDQLKSLSPEQQFYAIADALARVETQYEQTELGRAVFGRGFASLIPIIKEANGNLQETTEAIKATGDALSQETIDRIDAFGDALGAAAIQAKNEFLEAAAAILGVIDAVNRRIGSAEDFKNARLGNYGISDTSRRLTQEDVYTMQAKAKGYVTEPTKVSGYTLDADGNLHPPGQGKPTSPKVVRNTVKSIASTKGSDTDREQTRLLMERQRIIEQNRTAHERMVDDSVRANELFANDQEQRNRELQRAWEEYATAAETSTERARDSVEDLAVSIRASLANSFESALFDAESFGDSMTSILDGIARQIARTAIIDPLSSGITDVIGGSGLLSEVGSWFGGLFADGGRPPRGKVSVVGEEGPELFVPDSSGTIVPNHALGGGGVNVTNVFHISPGVQGTVQAEIRKVVPEIIAASQAGTLNAIERGGRAAQIVGKRS